jgi:hypothetical protein
MLAVLTRSTLHFLVGLWIFRHFAARGRSRPPWPKPPTPPRPAPPCPGPLPPGPRYGPLMARHFSSLESARQIDEALDRLIASDVAGDDFGFTLACADARRLLRVHATVCPEEVG